jgi:hypothetical protein
MLVVDVSLCAPLKLHTASPFEFSLHLRSLIWRSKKKIIEFFLYCLRLVLGSWNFRPCVEDVAEDQERCTRPVNLRYFCNTSLEGPRQITVSCTPLLPLPRHRPLEPCSELKCMVGCLQQTEDCSCTESRRHAMKVCGRAERGAPRILMLGGR